MKKEELKDAFVRGFSGFLSLSMVVLLYMLLQHLDSVMKTLGRIMGILSPFVMGCVIAYLLKIPCNFVDDRLISKVKSAKARKALNVVVIIVLVILVLALVYGFFSMVIPEVISSVNQLVVAMPGAVNMIRSWVNDYFVDSPQAQAFVNSGITSLENTLRTWVNGDLMPTLQSMLGSFASAFSTVAGVVYDFLVGLIVCVYLLAGRKRLARHFKAIIYAILKTDRADKLMRELNFVDSTFSGFFGGKLLDSLIVGVICYIFCLIMSRFTNFPEPLLISIVIGITNIIPYFGPFIGAIPCALLVLMNSPLNCLIFVIFILVLQQIDGNVIGPHILSNSIGLPGIWVLFSVMLFGGLFGLLGILVGVPVFAVFYDAMRRFVTRKLKEKGRLNVLLKTKE